MPSEIHSAMAGAMATLESRAIAEKVPSGPVVHKTGPIIGIAPNVYTVCQADGCGERFDGADGTQVKRLANQHTVDMRHAHQRADAKAVTPARLPAIRVRLRQITDQKGGPT